MLLLTTIAIAKVVVDIQYQHQPKILNHLVVNERRSQHHQMTIIMIVVVRIVHSNNLKVYQR